MFKVLDCETTKQEIRQGLRAFIRKIQTDVEHTRVINGSGDAMIRGHVCRASDDRTVDLAVNDTVANATWVGVMTEPTPDGQQGVMRTEGYAYVAFTGDIGAGNEGLPVYVSEVAGLATIVEPNPATSYIAICGLLADATEFDAVTNPFAWVWLGHCCARVARQ